MKKATKIFVLFLLVSVVGVPLYARLFGLIDDDTLETFGRFALSTTGPIGVLIGGLAAGSVARNRNGTTGG
jgi:uncharacterized membrane protein